MKTNRAAGANRIWQVVIGLALGLPMFVLAQNYVFGPNVRVNDDPPGAAGHLTYSPGQHLIAARGDTVYLAWMGNQDGGYHHIYFARSNDAGQHFLPNVRVDNAPSSIEAEMPGLAVDDSGRIHVCWLNHNATNAAFVYYAKSTNGGASFLPPVRACESLYTSQYAFPSIAVSRNGRRVYVARSERADGSSLPYTVYLSRSTDGGSTFLTPDVRVNPYDTTLSMYEPSVAVFNDTTVMVTWDGFRIWFARSTDGGGSFAPNTPLCDSGPVGYVNTSLGADTMGLVFGVWDGVNIVTSSDTGRTLTPYRRIPGVNGRYPSIWVARNGKAFLTWEFLVADGWYGEVRFSFTTDRGVTFSPPVNPSDGPGGCSESRATVTANQSDRVFVAWNDNRYDTLSLISDVFCASGALAGIEEAEPVRHDGLRCGVAPNPSGSVIRIRYEVPEPGPVKVEVYDANGRRVASLRDECGPAGRHDLLWDGSDNAGHRLGTGVYLLLIATRSASVTRKIELVTE